jgi:hypothetical protein
VTIQLTDDELAELTDAELAELYDRTRAAKATGPVVRYSGNGYWNVTDDRTGPDGEQGPKGDPGVVLSSSTGFQEVAGRPVPDGPGSPQLAVNPMYTVNPQAVLAPDGSNAWEYTAAGTAIVTVTVNMMYNNVEQVAWVDLYQYQGGWVRQALASIPPGMSTMSYTSVSRVDIGTLQSVNFYKIDRQWTTGAPVNTIVTIVMVK